MILFPRRDATPLNVGVLVNRAEWNGEEALCEKCLLYRKSQDLKKDPNMVEKAKTRSVVETF